MRLGSYDPTCLVRDDTFVKAFWTPEGPCTLALRQEGWTIQAEAVGEGARWALDRVPRMFAFEESQELPRDSHRWIQDRFIRHQGIRVTPILWPGDLLVAVILQQRVTWRDAANAWRKLTLEFGEKAPGPLSLRTPLTGRQWAGLPMVALRKYDVDMRRAGAIRNAGPHLHKLDRSTCRVEMRRILSALPGVGPWTRENVMGFGAGDPDAVPLGDLHLPKLVGEHFEGIPGDDARMLQLLERYAGVRFRVVLWVFSG